MSENRWSPWSLYSWSNRNCVRAQSRACFPCICTRMRAYCTYTSFICTRMRAWAHEHPQTCAHVWCPYVHHTRTRSTLVHPQPCAHMRTRCAATLTLTDHGLPHYPQGARSKAIRSPWIGPGLDELGEATMRWERSKTGTRVVGLREGNRSVSGVPENSCGAEC